MGLETLNTALDEGQALEPLTADELKSDELADESALKLVVQDVEVAERFIGSKALPGEWNTVEDLYRAFVIPEKWGATNLPKAALSMPLILEAIENMLSQIHMAFFSDPQPFGLDPKGPTPPPAARVMAKVLCWSMKLAGAKEEIRKTLKSSLEYGQCVLKWGWQVTAHEKDTYKRDGDKVSKSTKKYEIAHPTAEFVELRNILVDPSLRNHDIRNARFVIHQSFWTPEELDDLRDAGYKNVPSREELAAIMAEKGEQTDNSMLASKVETYRAYQAERQDTEFSANPMNKPLELLEHWTGERNVTVLQRKFVLRNEDHDFKKVPFLSCAFIDVLGSFYGFGVARLLAGEQMFQTGVVNRWINGLDLKLNPMWHRKKGVGSTAQNIVSEPGKVVSDEGDLTPIQVAVDSAEALEAIATSEARANRRVGSNFGQEMPTQAMRTAEGVNSFTAGVQVRLQYFIENFAEMVFIPMLENFIQLAKDNLQPDDLAAILTDEDGKVYEQNVLDVYNGTYSVEVLSSTKLAARRAMIGLVQQFVQLLAAEPVQNAMLVQGKKVDWVEFVQNAIDLTGFPASGWIVDATPDDMQRAQQMNPAVIQAQAKGQLEQQQHGNDMELEEQKATGRAGVSVVKHILDQSAEPEPTAAAPLATALEGGPIATQQ